MTDALCSNRNENAALPKKHLEAAGQNNSCMTARHILITVLVVGTLAAGAWYTNYFSLGAPLSSACLAGAALISLALSLALAKKNGIPSNAVQVQRNQFNRPKVLPQKPPQRNPSPSVATSPVKDQNKTREPEPAKSEAPSTATSSSAATVTSSSTAITASTTTSSSSSSSAATSSTASSLILPPPIVTSPMPSPQATTSTPPPPPPNSPQTTVLQTETNSPSSLVISPMTPQKIEVDPGVVSDFIKVLNSKNLKNIQEKLPSNLKARLEIFKKFTKFINDIKKGKTALLILQAEHLANAWQTAAREDHEACLRELLTNSKFNKPKRIEVAKKAVKDLPNGGEVCKILELTPKAKS